MARLRGFTQSANKVVQPLARLRITILLLSLFCIISPSNLLAQASQIHFDDELKSTLSTLQSFVALQSKLKKEIGALTRETRKTKSDNTKRELKARISRLEAELASAEHDFEYVAAGNDASQLWDKNDSKFNFQQELLSLLKPAMKEMKHMTSNVRRKSELRDKISYYRERIPVAEEAIANIKHLIAANKNRALNARLNNTLNRLQNQLAVRKNQLQAAELQMNKLRRTEVSFAEASKDHLKEFFQKRGLYLTFAALTMLAVFVLSRFAHFTLSKAIKGYHEQQRSFRIRLLDLTLRMLTVVLIAISPIFVFYYVEDWMLLSLTILFLFGISWTLSKTLPRYWQQIQLFLNIGSVREGERVFLDGLPWAVKQINLFTKLENPTTGLKQRVPIADLVELKSRPIKKEEPWFPCRKGDWVILNDGVRGKVTGISQELIELIERGGAHKTYLTADFLQQAPRNLSTNFRIKETIGISYDLQKESTSSILVTLRQHVEKCLYNEGYGDVLLNLRVEFQEANTSSLDLVVIVDFKGEVGDLYNRLRRAIQRWCVDACSTYNWEIPFTQLSLHGVDLHTQQRVS